MKRFFIITLSILTLFLVIPSCSSPSSSGLVGLWQATGKPLNNSITIEFLQDGKTLIWGYPSGDSSGNYRVLDDNRLELGNSVIKYSISKDQLTMEYGGNLYHYNRVTSKDVLPPTPLNGQWQLSIVKIRNLSKSPPGIMKGLLSSRIEFNQNINNRWLKIQADGSYKGNDHYNYPDYGKETQEPTGAFKIIGNQLFLYDDSAIGYRGQPIPHAIEAEFGWSIKDPNTGTYYSPKFTINKENLILTFISTNTKDANVVFFTLEYVKSSASSKDIKPQFLDLGMP
jgi:hypothetical protein